MVERHWETPIVIGSVDLKGIVREDWASASSPGGPAFERLATGAVIADEERLRSVFQMSFNELAQAQGRPPLAEVHLEIQVWRHGYDVAAAAHPAGLVGWCVLAAGPGQHPESAAISFADPRAGSAMTAMPGLPWGRPILLNPVPGAHAAAPGWLIWSIVPVERGQHVIVAVASSAQ
ncbi:MAG TPA: hypothetical protein VFU43_00085 [Streptosporangiaceae bacterium]|nr:hypothetical protein [Streptosporangiaceae bacterium]